MSQANDVARGRHFRYYLAGSVPREAKCEPGHGRYGAERNTYCLAYSPARWPVRKQRTACTCRDALGTKKRKASRKHSNRGPNYVTFARRGIAGGESGVTCMKMERGIVNSRTQMLREHGLLRRLGMPALAAGAALVAGCSGNAQIDVANNQTADPATVDFPIFYVKRTIPPTTDDLRMLRDAVKPTQNDVTVPAADLFKRDSASPSANEHNITTRITK